MRTVADLAGILQLFEAPPLVLVLILVAVAFDFINGFTTLRMPLPQSAAPGKCEVKRLGALRHRNDRMAVPCDPRFKG